MTQTASPRWMARIVAVLLTIAASCAVTVLATPTSARADSAPPQMVQFSTNGLTWSNTYDEQLFRGIVLVPGGSGMRSFYVRNIADEAAKLRITLANVGTTSIPLASALSVSSSVAGVPGAFVPVSLAQPCYTLSEGLRLSSGDSIRVDNTVTLGDLSGSLGQDASVWFAIRVSLSSTDVAAPAPDTCPVDYGTVETFPNPTTPGPTTPASTHSTPVYHRTAAGWTVGTSVGGGTVTTPTTPGTPVEPSTPLAQTLVSNTARLYQEYDVAFWLAMSVLGAVILVLVRRRRAEDQPEASAPSQQIGNRR